MSPLKLFLLIPISIGELLLILMKLQAFELTKLRCKLCWKIRRNQFRWLNYICCAVAGGNENACNRDSMAIITTVISTTTSLTFTTEAIT